MYLFCNSEPAQSSSVLNHLRLKHDAQSLYPSAKQRRLHQTLAKRHSAVTSAHMTAYCNNNRSQDDSERCVAHQPEWIWKTNEMMSPKIHHKVTLKKLFTFTKALHTRNTHYNQTPGHWFWLLLHYIWFFNKLDSGRYTHERTTHKRHRFRSMLSKIRGSRVLQSERFYCC